MKDEAITSKQQTSRNGASSLPVDNFWLSTYAVSRHWKSDLFFFGDEVNFFHLLITKHLSILISPASTNPVRRLIARVNDLEALRQSLLGKIEAHILHIETFIENPFAHNSQDYRDTHEKLESEFAIFVKTYKDIKTEVFKMTESVLQLKK